MGRTLTAVIVAPALLCWLAGVACSSSTDSAIPSADSGKGADASWEGGGQETGVESGLDARETSVEGGSCSPVSPAAEVDPWSVRVAGVGFQGIVTEPWVDWKGKQWTHTYLKSPEDYLRIGVRQEWGGVIQFFGLAGQPNTNVIDEGAPDPGRQIQIALYDDVRGWQGCSWNASCPTGKCPQTGNSFAGWDPVWGGDSCLRGSPLTSVEPQGEGMRVVTSPAQWNPAWDVANCEERSCEGPPRFDPKLVLRADFRFVATHVVEVALEIDNQDGMDHAMAPQEYPCAYLSYRRGGSGEDCPTKLTRMFLADGSEAIWDGSTGFDTKGGPWVTWQTAAADYGVGLAMDNGVHEFTGMKLDTDGFYARYTKPEMRFAIPNGSKVRTLFYLALGGLDTVNAFLTNLFQRRPPFGALEVPSAGSPTTYSPGSSVPVQGWVLDTAHVSQVQVTVDGSPVEHWDVDQERNDICSTYPLYDGCPKVGFSGLVPTVGLDQCAHLVRVTATDGDGNKTVLGERVIEPKL